MNKVTKDIQKWFPILSKNNAMVVHTQMMYDGVDFSEATDNELKQAALNAMMAVYPVALRMFLRTQSTESHYLKD